MRKTQADGNIGNEFTNGNPATNQVATAQDSQWCNDVQNEICNLIESTGLTLDDADYLDAGDTPDQNQLAAAIGVMITNGGTQTELDILNNTADADLTGLVFNKLNVKAVKILVHLKRRTDSAALKEFGEIFLILDEETNLWDIIFRSDWDDSGVEFSVDVDGQISYTSDDLVGVSYVGKIKFLDIKIVNI